MLELQFFKRALETWYSIFPYWGLCRVIDCIGAGGEQVEFSHDYLVAKEMSFIYEMFSEIISVKKSQI